MDASATQQHSVEERIEELASQVELVDVRTVSVSGQIVGESTSRPADVELEVSSGYRVERGNLYVRYHGSLSVLDEEKSKIALLNVALVLTFTAPDLAMPERDVMTAMINDRIFLIAAPFLREAFQSIAVRLGLPALTMGFFRVSQQSVTIAIRGDEDSSSS